MDYLRRIRLIGLIDWFMPGALLAVALMAADPGPESRPPAPLAGEVPLKLGSMHGAPNVRLISTGEQDGEHFTGRPTAGRHEPGRGQR